MTTRLKCIAKTFFIVLFFSITGKICAQEKIDIAPAPGSDIGVNESLYVLEADIDEFNNLKSKRLVFSFTVNEDGKLTLDGWLYKVRKPKRNGKEEDKKVIKKIISLTPALPTNKKWKPGNYFGSLVLYKIKAVQRDIKAEQEEKKAKEKELYEKPNAILFVPGYVGNHITYKICAGKVYRDTNNDNKITSVVALGREAGQINPSPPRNW